MKYSTLIDINKLIEKKATLINFEIFLLNEKKAIKKQMLLFYNNFDLKASEIKVVINADLPIEDFPTSWATGGKKIPSNPHISSYKVIMSKDGVETEYSSCPGLYLSAKEKKKLLKWELPLWVIIWEYYYYNFPENNMIFEFENIENTGYLSYPMNTYKIKKSEFMDLLNKKCALINENNNKIENLTVTKKKEK